MRMSNRDGWLRCSIITTVVAEDGKSSSEQPAMTSISVSIPKGLSMTAAKAQALEWITEELDRYGIEEALGPLFPPRG